MKVFKFIIYLQVAQYTLPITYKHKTVAHTQNDRNQMSIFMLIVNQQIFVCYFHDFRIH